MKYRIVSPRLGTPGEIYDPPVWVNIGHLLSGGFIEPADGEKAADTTQDDPKPAKKNTTKKVED